MGRWEMGNGTRRTTTSSPKNHKLAKKPQARQKTTSSPKNHKPDKKPQARPKTTSQTKNHKFAQKPQARQKTTKTAKNHIIGFWRLFLFLTRNALRALDTHQTLLRCPCAWLLVAFPVSDTQCATRTGHASNFASMPLRVAFGGFSRF